MEIEPEIEFGSFGRLEDYGYAYEMTPEEYQYECDLLRWSIEEERSAKTNMLMKSGIILNNAIDELMENVLRELMDTVLTAF